jgi:hypothetical protein
VVRMVVALYIIVWVVFRGGAPAYLSCRRAVTRFNLLQQLLLLLLAATAAGCLLTSTESCCRWQSALYLAFLKLLIHPDIIAVSQDLCSTVQHYTAVPRSRYSRRKLAGIKRSL